MKKYEQYKLDDFLKDDFFMGWLKDGSKEKDHFWNNWIERNPEKIGTILKAKEIFHSIDYEHSPEPDEHRYHEILENVLKSDGNAKMQRSSKLNLKYWAQTVVKYAAMILIFAGISFMVYEYAVIDQPVPVAESTDIRMLSKEIPKGKKLSLNLSDGSTIKLNAESKLIFPERFLGNTREVILEGEAFFNIARNPEKPFIIKSGDLVVTVLGTSFNVNAYTDNNKVQVAVASGKVAVRSNEKEWKDNTTFLTKNQVLTFNKETRSLKSEIMDVSDLIAWKDKTLVFEDATLETIVKQLERWYDVEIETRVDNRTIRKFNGKYTNQTLVDVLDGICYSSKLKYNLQDKKVTIYEN